MKVKLNALALSLLIGLSTEYSEATDYIQGSVLSDKVFYQIGGGAAVMPPPSRHRPNELAIGFGWKSNLTCGNFDIKTTVKNQLNGITDGFKDLYGNIISSATGAVASLPAMIIQRASPQLYDLMMNGTYQAKLDFDSLKTSCEAMSEKLADYAIDSKWAKMAGIERLKEIIASGEVDIKRAKKELDKYLGEKGVPWVGGENKGGKDQGPIEALKDAVRAGYNMSLGRAVGDTTKVAPVSCDGRLCTEWQSPDDAINYARDVLGSKALMTCQSCPTPTKSQAGTGLAPKIEKQTIEKMKALEEVLNAESVTNEQLAALSTSAVGVTRGLIEALKESLDVQLLSARLSQELAISHELEKALVLRRVLLVGMKEPNIENNPQGQEEIEKALKMLDQEIQQVKMEMELQRAIGTNTAISILNSRTSEHRRSTESNTGDNRRLDLTAKIGSDEPDNSNAGGFYARDGRIVLPIPDDTTGLGSMSFTYAPGTGSASSYGSGGMGGGSTSYSPISMISGTAMAQATELLKTFEGYRSKAYYDVNAYRTGYGSDTITTADGRVIKVTKDTVTTKEDAERDLARRTPQFANTAKKQVSAELWDKLPANAQAALTSFSYNYGSLKKDVIQAAKISAQTGDMTALANAVRNRQTDNNGVNARRRNQEADYILGNQKQN